MTTIGALRRRALTPKISETELKVRGFHVKSDAARDQLERVGATFITGYAYAAEAATAAQAEAKLELIEPEFRGFAYEGAGMGFAIRDGLPIGGSHHFADFVAGRGKNHAYMAYIGLGWAMGRLPHFRWSRITVADPFMRWLVLDGYGFHQAYFHTDRYVHEQYREPDFRWPSEGKRWYANHAIDQGIGRALWFVGCTDVEVVNSLIQKYPADRHADFWAGAGLAATYAGGVTEDELRRFAELAGEFRPQVSQGSAFAATARTEAGLITEHTTMATGIFCDMTPAQATAASAAARPAGEDDSDVPAYEIWRVRLATQFAGLGQR
jgi:hypothetical protein